ncbi:MAG: 2OG-Fe(II) oxygenase, partial [Rhizobacter sp.]|nr:2OG-Fe(II) oxygenase [Rhizobacter sp.]
MSHMPTPFSPLPEGAAFCVVIPQFLSAQECRQHIAASEARGFAGAGSDYPPSYRNNDRQVLDDPLLARQMLSRLVPHAPASLQHAGASWALHSVNERFRLCRYRAGQQFNIHQDGVHHRAAGLQSRLTFMVYLTDG